MRLQRPEQSSKFPVSDKHVIIKYSYCCTYKAYKDRNWPVWFSKMNWIASQEDFKVIKRAEDAGAHFQYSLKTRVAQFFYFIFLYWSKAFCERLVSRQTCQKPALTEWRRFVCSGATREEMSVFQLWSPWKQDNPRAPNGKPGRHLTSQKRIQQ